VKRILPCDVKSGYPLEKLLLFYSLSTQFSSYSYLHDRVTVRSGASALGVPCQEWCRYPSGALSGVVQVPLRCPVRSGAEIGLLSLRSSVLRGVLLGDFLLAPAYPHREGNSMGGLPLFNVGIRN